MYFKKIITLVLIAMMTFLFVSKPIMINSVVSAREVVGTDGSGGGGGSGSENMDCSEMLGDKSDSDSLANILDSAYLIMRVAAILLTVVLGMLDFTKAIWSNDQDGLKKAQQKFVKRLIAMVVIIILPFIIDPIIELALGSGYDSCGVGSTS